MNMKLKCSVSFETSKTITIKKIVKNIYYFQEIYNFEMT